MKTTAESFGFERLITVFAPATITAIALALICAESGGHPNQAMAWLEDRGWKLSEWQTTFSAVLVLSVIGSVVGSINGMIEALLYDWITAKRIGVTGDEFDEQWHNYLIDLPNSKNAYIDRVVFFFHFETRMAVALTLLAFAFWWAEYDALLYCSVGASVLMFAIGLSHHKELATYRKKWFAITSPSPALAQESPPTPTNQTPTNQTPTNQTPTNQTPTNQTPTNQTPTNASEQAQEGDVTPGDL